MVALRKFKNSENKNRKRTKKVVALRKFKNYKTAETPKWWLLYVALRKFKNSKIQKPQKHQNGGCSQKFKNYKTAKAPKRWLLSENSKIQKPQKHQNGGCSMLLSEIPKFKNRKSTKTVVALRKLKNYRFQQNQCNEFPDGRSKISKRHTLSDSSKKWEIKAQKYQNGTGCQTHAILKIKNATSSKFLALSNIWRSQEAYKPQNGRRPEEMSTFNKSHIPKQTKTPTWQALTKKHKKHAIHQDDGRLQKSEPFSNLKSAEPSKKQMVSEKSKIQEAQHVGT